MPASCDSPLSRPSDAASARPAPAHGPAHRWKVLGVGVAANAAFSAAAAGIPTTAVWLRAGYRLDNAQLGLALGALGLGVALSELPWGLAADRFGDRPVLLAGLAATAATLLATAAWLAPSAGFVPPLAALMAALCLAGLLGGSVNGASGRAVMRWFREGERGFAMSVRQTAVPLGGGLGALALPWLASSAGFAWVFGALGLACALAAWLTWAWLHEPPQALSATVPAAAAPRPAAAPAGTRGPLRDVAVWRLVGGIGILCVPQFAVLTFATVYLHDFARMGLAGMSATMVAVQAGAMAMRVWSGRLTDRRGNRRGYLRASTWAAAGTFLLLALASAGAPAAVPLLALLLVTAGISVSAWHGVAYTELATLAGAERAGTALGMANTIVYLGFFLTPLLIPALLAASAWPWVWAVAGMAALAALPLFAPARG